ncbi:MAG TPA: metalloregulator ArsR/SmtB family transcription factor [Polyangia bacterium]|jgi:DNA-binding transcriptional ArsR family regulator
MHSQRVSEAPVTPSVRPAGLPARPATSHPTASPAAPPLSPPLDEREALAVAEVFRSLADPTRLRILALLAEGETCVHVLCQRLGMSQSAVSHQLRLLRVCHLVRPRRVGREIFYAIDDDHVEMLIREGRRHAGCAAEEP